MAFFNAVLKSLEITRLHDEANLRWHQEPQPLLPPALLWPMPANDASLVELVQAHHRANFDLWHEEDKAREPDVTDATITRVKHAIDVLNQRRNDLVEQMDRQMLQAAGEQNPTAPLQSESPGLIVDRLSILALKLYHTAEEAHRPTAGDGHWQKNRARLILLEEQRDDLACCFDQLWQEVMAGRRRFKLYRQMKMYNDPELNPSVYSHKSCT